MDERGPIVSPAPSPTGRTRRSVLGGAAAFDTVLGLGSCLGYTAARQATPIPDLADDESLPPSSQKEVTT